MSNETSGSLKKEILIKSHERQILKLKLKKNKLEQELLQERLDNFNKIGKSDIPCHIILLERDSERVNHVENHILNKIPKAVKFSAIDYEKDDLSKIMEGLKVTITNEFRIKYKSGQLACFLSHMSLWKKIVDDNIPEMIILEDDATIPDNFYEKLNEMRSELPSDYDILYLFIHPLQYKDVKVHTEHLIPGKNNIVKRYTSYGTVGYMMSLKAARYLLSTFKEINITVDNQLATIVGERLCFNPAENFIGTAGQINPKDKDRFKSNIWWSDFVKNTLPESQVDIKTQCQKDITIGIKTFIRPDCCLRLVKSIREKYPDIKILVADDGDKSPNLSEFNNLECFKMEFDSGVSAGRNLLIDNTKTKYYLTVDDDMIFTEDTNLEIAYEILEENPQLDMVGGKVGAAKYHGLLKKENNVMTLHKGESKNNINGHLIYDIILQFYLVKAEKIKQIKYDPELKIVDHMEFFWRAKDFLNITYIGDTYNFGIINKSDSSNKDYIKFRKRDEYIKLAKQKMGVEEITTSN